MYLAYIDTSGDMIFEQPENCALSAIIINECHWQLIDNKIKVIKLKHFPTIPDEDVEIHAKDMINRKGLFKNLDWNQIYQVLTEVFAVMSSPDSNLSIISVLINKHDLKKRIDIQQWGYRLLFERLNMFIERKNKENTERLLPNDYCIMIMDTEGITKDQNLRKKLINMLRNGTYFSRLDFLIEDPLFTDSKWRNLSQLADCTAYCIRKQYRKNNKYNFHTVQWKDYFNKLTSKFDRNPQTGDYFGYGLKIWP